METQQTYNLLTVSSVIFEDILLSVCFISLQEIILHTTLCRCTSVSLFVIIRKKTFIEKGRSIRSFEGLLKYYRMKNLKTEL